MKYFKLKEFLYSRVAAEHRISNKPDTKAERAIELLVDKCLDPMREAYGRPILVSSGYRSEAVNRYVGGVSNSQHLTGEAADLVPCAGGSLRDMALAAYDRADFDQLIIEQPMTSRWLHVSHSADGNQRREVLYYDGRHYQEVGRDFLEAL